MIRKTLHPEGYHGRREQSPYFEGWYFKVVDATQAHRYAIIPGISLGGAADGPHSFVQVLDGVSGRTSYHRYPIDAFHADEHTLDVKVGENRFDARGLTLSLKDGDLPLTGTVRFSGLKPWPVTLAEPGIMGWYAWVPRMECYHGVLSLDHGLDGTLETERGSVAFGGGRGYIEKDWGRSFPAGWIWMQSNHFANTGICITASTAIIPWLGTAFPGFIVGLLVNGTLYRFATYTGATITHLSVEEHVVVWQLEDDLYQLNLVVQRAPAGELRGPSKADMGRPVAETLSASIAVQLSAREGGVPIFAGTGRHAGVEVAGDIEALLTSPPEA